MILKSDLLVIGGGLAGLVAGTIATESGASTILLRKGQSATAFSSGAIDIIGYLPDAAESISDPSEGLTAIAGLYPLHPYGVVGYGDDVAPEEVVDAIIGRVRDTVVWLKNHLQGTIASVVGDFNTNIYPITILGTTKPTCLVQETMNPGNVNEHEDSVLLFAGFTGYPDFNPSAAAKTYLEDRMALGQPPHKIGHCMTQLMPFRKSFNISSIEIARHLDHAGSMETLARQLEPHVNQIGATHVAIPPVLGYRHALKNKLELEKLIGAEVFELLAFPPSIPGLRLQQALEEVYTKAGGKMLVGHEATSYTKIGQKIKTVVARSPRREISIDTKAIVLATGKYIGGGIAGDEKGLRETVFDIMTVTADYHSAKDILPSKATNRLEISPMGQQLQWCGLSIDPQFRPIREDGLEWADNVFAAGAVLAGYNYSVEKSGLGVALTSGYSAAKSAIKCINGGGGN
ncbi:MAG: anaerobic glycerol-3-phosphate dehydrogenase subunit GlpB [Candidatus Odinarchaeota archaeon]